MDGTAPLELLEPHCEWRSEALADSYVVELSPAHLDELDEALRYAEAHTADEERDRHLTGGPLCERVGRDPTRSEAGPRGLGASDRRWLGEQQLMCDELRSEAGLPRERARAVGPGELHHLEGVGAVPGERVVLGEGGEQGRRARSVHGQEGARLLAVEQADERCPDRQVGAAGERVRHEVEESTTGNGREPDDADLGEPEALREADRVGVAGKGWIEVGPGGDGVERPSFALEHEDHLVAVAHAPVGEDVLVVHPVSLPDADCWRG